MLRFTASQMAAFEALSRARTPDRALATLREQGIDASRDPASGDVLAKDASGNVSRFQFATDGRLDAFRWPSGRTLRFGYDDRGRLASVAHPDGTLIRYERDAQGRVSACESVGHARYEFGYDEASRLARVTYPDGRVEAAEFDESGALSAYTAPSGVRRSFVREVDREVQVDALGRRFGVRIDPAQKLQGTDFPDGAREDYEFDEEAGVARIVQRDRSTVEIAADLEERPATLRWSDGQQLRFAYDDRGRVTTAATASGHVTLSYDNADRLTGEVDEAGKVELAHDDDGRPVRVASPCGEVHYEYDPDGRLAAVVDWDGRKVLFRYGDGNAPSEIEYPNRVVETFTRSRQPLAVRSVLRGSDGRTLGGWWLELDACDRVAKLIDAWGDTRDQQLRRAMRYDPGGRLAGETNTAPGTALSDFAYDAAGNMVRDGALPVTIGPLDQVVARGSSQVTYDARGNATEVDSSRGRVKCRYSADNRLRQVDVGGRTWRYDYDALCRRIAKTDGVQAWTFGWVGTCMLWEEHRPAPGAPSTRRDYLYAPGFAAPIAFREAGRTVWLSHDHRGAVIAAHDDSGKVVWRGLYDGFGNVRALIDEVRQPWRLAGQYEDAETGLYYNFARYYSPLLKTYLSFDPRCADLRARNYAYCDNDPWNRVDTEGMLPVILAAALVGGIVGGIASGLMSDRPTPGGKLKDAAAGFVAGAVGGILATVLLPVNPVLGGAIVGAVEGGLQSVLSNVFNGERVDWECAGYSALAGAAVGAVTAGLGGTVGRAVIRRLAPKLPPLLYTLKGTPAKIARSLRRLLSKPRLNRLAKEGHGPQRHEGDVTEQQLKDRAMHGKDPLTGTTTDGVHGGTHKYGRDATKINTPEGYVDAENYLRASDEFKREAAKADANGKTRMVVKESKLEDIYGPNYRNEVSGQTRVGSKNHPTGTTPTDLTDGTMKAVYDKDPISGEWKLTTMYPETKP